MCRISCERVHRQFCVHRNCVSVCTNFSANNTVVHGIIFLYISTKGTGLYVVTFMDESKLNTFVCGRSEAYNKHGKYKPIGDIGTDVV